MACRASPCPSSDAVVVAAAASASDAGASSFLPSSFFASSLGASSFFPSSAFFPSSFFAASSFFASSFFSGGGSTFAGPTDTMLAACQNLRSLLTTLTGSTVPITVIFLPIISIDISSIPTYIHCFVTLT
nr:hypothetical protein Iba_chr04aCG16350 [Ipomoea batatas]GMC82583.1 hypothetical protein Iba_chr04bCG14750 [Ipomoea batatas]GMC91168.1 hypothetical protein Iba_chr04fCG14820 [Ipomoea batatas]